MHRTVQNYFLWLDSLMLTEDQLLVQKIDTMTGEKWRILVPDDMKQEVFELCHMTDGAAHFGIHATVSRILRTFNYPGLQTDVRLRIAACHHCLQKVTQARLHSGIHVPIRNGYPLQSLNIDFIAGLNTCADGTTTVLSLRMITVLPALSTQGSSSYECYPFTDGFVHSCFWLSGRD